MPTREEILTFLDDPGPPGSTSWVSRTGSARAEGADTPRLSEIIEIVDHDGRWAEQAMNVAARIRAALGMRAIRVEHVGSTAVPGLAAKPILDLDVTVEDPTKEDLWVAPLEALGLILTIREPWWYEHRLLQGTAPRVNVHVFGPDCPELVRHVIFRDWLCTNSEDRILYAKTKRSCAQQASSQGETVMEYNARKQPVVREIYGRAFAAAGFFD